MPDFPTNGLFAGAGLIPGSHLKLLMDEGQTTLGLSGKADWVLVNDGAWGFYRVRYDADLLRRLTVDIQSRLSPLERFTLDLSRYLVSALGPV